ncbi:hypothetical protein FOZ62_023842, partial [Perkinsus olseni]
IRVRPISGIEERQTLVHHLKEKTCIQTSPRDPSIRVTDPLDINSQRVYSYDAVFDSSSSNRPATQEEVYQRLGRQLLDRALEGYNTCLLAYGVVGTGKTYSLHGKMGDGEEGIVPRFIKDIFEHSEQLYLSYYELYNDRLHDLLRTSEHQEELLLHHHPKLGVYIENLKESACDSAQSATDLLKFGRKLRSASHTNFNSHGSRSHTILRLRFEIEGRMTTAHFVDLAGQEDTKHGEMSGHKLKELSFVNKSLFELANCIHSLSSNQHHHAGQPVPFRNSKLTLLLSDCLIGNCKTHMLATISPASVAYHSSVSTLRFASTVKGIKCRCFPLEKGNCNEHVMKLEAEVTDLKGQLADLKEAHPAAGLCAKEVEEKLRAMKAARDKYKQQWHDAVQEASLHSGQRLGLLKRLGVSSDAEEPVDPSSGLLYPFLMDLSDDAYTSGGRLLYFLHKSSTTIGSSDINTIILRGAGMEPHMLTIDKKYAHRDGGAVADLHLTASVPTSSSGRVLVNGRRIPSGSPFELQQGDRLILGHARVFRIVMPADGETIEHHSQLQEAEMREAHSKGLPTPVEAALSEVKDEHSVEFNRLRPLIRRVLEESPAERVEVFLRRLHPACSLVDEANRLTHEIRPQDNLVFELAVIETTAPERRRGGEADEAEGSPSRRAASAPSSSSPRKAGSPRKTRLPADDPIAPMALVVRLIQKPPPEAGTLEMFKWRKAINDVVEKIRARKRREPHAHSPTLSTSVHGLSREVADLLGISSREVGPLDDVPADGSGHARAAAALPSTPREISVWSFAKFEQRLSQIRDVHRVTTGDHPIAFDHYIAENPGSDPWRDWGPQSVSAMLDRIADLEARLEHALSERGKDDQIRALREQVTTLEAEHRANRRLELETDLREIEKIERLEAKAYTSKYAA